MLYTLSVLKVLMILTGSVPFAHQALPKSQLAGGHVNKLVGRGALPRPVKVCFTTSYKLRFLPMSGLILHAHVQFNASFV